MTMKNQRAVFVWITLLGLFLNGPRLFAQEGLVISEFLAVNNSVIKDDFGQYSDYIELYNGSASPINLDGYYLTDTLANLTQWRFPATNLLAGQHLLLWASGRDRKQPGLALHTNFKLSSSGESVALTKPDGTTVVHQYTYGPQVADRSYGLEAQVLSTATLIAGQSSALYYIPTNNNQSNRWTAVAYDASTWNSGNTGLGYDTNVPSLFAPYISTDLRAPMQLGPNKRSSVYVRIPLVLDDLAKVHNPVISVRYDDAFVMYFNGKEIARRGISSTLTPSPVTLALVGRTNSTVVVPEEIPSLGILQNMRVGTNILAIQVMNKALGDGDFLIYPEIFDRQIEYHVESERYFATPSPGVGNAVGLDGLSSDLQFSVKSTTFFNTFELEIKPVDPTAVGEIRFSLGSAVPTTNSLLYTGPLSITNSAQIRARLFEPGFLPGRVHTEAYIKLSPAMQTVSSDIPLLLVHSFGVGPFDENNKKPCIVFVHEPFRGRSSFTNAPDMVFRAGFKIRGSSTAGNPKYNWAVDSWDQDDQDTDIPLLGMPSASEWVFHGPYQFDPSLIHNPFASEMSTGIGRYAGRYRFAEIYLNEKSATNAASVIVPQNYFGLYNILERIGVRPNRLNLAKLTDGDTQEPEVTGGYSMSVDRDFGGSPQEAAGGISFNYIEPKFEQLSQPQRAPQRAYIVKYLNDFAKAFNSKTWTNVDGTGYSQYIDRGSWIDFHIVNEFSLNVDALRLSTYFYKDRNAPLSFGPIWDFDRAFGSTDGRDNEPAVWDDGTGFFTYPWWGRLFADVNFWQAWIDRYQELRDGLFSDRSLFALIDKLNAQVFESAPRDFTRWGQAKRGGSQTTEIAYFKNWLGRHTAFMDKQLLDKPTLLTTPGRVPSGTLLTLTAPAGATIYYTLDGTDPRALHGLISPTAKIYSGPIPITGEVRLSARSRDPQHKNSTGGDNPPVNSIWSGPRTARFTLEALAAPGDLAVSEIHYQPSGPSNSESATNPSWIADDFEFLELINLSSHRLDLFGCRFTQGITFTFDDTSTYLLEPGARLLLVRNQAAFAARYGSAGTVAGEYVGSLSDAGEQLRMESSSGTVLIDFNYNNAWYPATAGYGFSLVKRDVQSPATTREAWAPSSAAGGSPGSADAVSTIPHVVVNEVLANSDTPNVDTIELLNLGAVPADVAGWYLTDDAAFPKKYALPAGSVIPAGGFLKVTEKEFGDAKLGDLAFQLSSHGEEIWLFSADSKGNLSGYTHGFKFGASDANVSFGRHLLSTDEEVFVADSRLTLGSGNDAPSVGPVILTQIHYHPLDIPANGKLWDNDEDEYIEIQNVSQSTVSFYDSASSSEWHLRGDVDFNFPTNFTLVAGARAVIVGFNPSTNPDRLARFKSTFQVPDGVAILGGFQGHLDNGSGQVRLNKPGPVDSNNGDVFYVVVDEVDYKDTAPWPAAPDGGGAALVRKSATVLGLEPANWYAGPPSPGRSAPVGDAPQILQAPGDKTAVAGTEFRLEVSVQSSTPVRFQWRHDGANVPNATNAVLVIKPLTPADAGLYEVVALNAYSAVQSAPSRLNVLLPATIIDDPNSQNLKPGATAQFAVVARGVGTLRYQWYFKGKAIAGATTFALTVPNVQLENSGPYTVVVTDDIGSATSAPAQLNVLVRPVFTIQPQSVVALQGDTVVLGVKAEGLEPISYRWRRGLSNINGATNNLLVLNNIQPTATGPYSVLVTNLATGSAGTNSVVANIIVMADADHDGMGDSWELDHNLSPTDPSDAARDDDQDGQTNLQEFIAGTDPKDKNSVLRIDSIKVGTNGTSLSFVVHTNRGYTLQFKEALDRGTWLPVAQVSGRTNEQTLTVLDDLPASGSRLYRLAAPPQYDTPFSGPTLLTSPVSQTLDEGDTAEFTVQAAGVGDLSYQWFIGATAISGATSASFNIENVKVSDEGSYSVQVTDDSGSVRSQSASLIVLQKPTIVTQPEGRTLKAGESYTLKVVATGAATLSYQWYKEDQLLQGANNAELTLNAVTLQDRARYRVLVKMATGHGEQRRSSSWASILVIDE